jgi:hypothetical protein
VTEQGYAARVPSTGSATFRIRSARASLGCSDGKDCFARKNAIYTVWEQYTR